MLVYRHWESRWEEEAVTLGKVTLFPAAKYWSIEQKALQDDMELTVLGERGATHFENTDSDPQLVDALARHGMAVSGKNIHIGNIRAFRRGPPCLVFCMSLDSRLGKFDEEGAIPKDAVTPILDVRVLYWALRRALSDQIELGEGKGGYGAVQYSERVYVIGGPELKPNPFVKPVKFASDLEVRICFQPLDASASLAVAQSDELRQLFQMWREVSAIASA